MTQAKHKQWRVVNGYYPRFREIEGPSFTLAVCIQAPDITLEDAMQRQSDMALIAAAPELLEALKTLLDREWQDDEGDKSLIDARKQAVEAIAKAGGAA